MGPTEHTLFMGWGVGCATYLPVLPVPGSGKEK